MNRRATSILLTLTLAVSSLCAQSEERKLILSIGGGLPGARTLTVTLLGNGEFTATGSGLPITDSGLTKLEHHAIISKADSAQAFELATQAAVEWRAEGEPWPDCKWAELQIHQVPQSVDVGSGCLPEGWLVRRKIKELLAFLDHVLPSGWRTNDVITF